MEVAVAVAVAQGHDPALIAAEEQYFAAVAETSEQSIAELSDRINAQRTLDATSIGT